MRLILGAAIGMCVSLSLSSGRAQTSTEWDQPAASLAKQISGILGPGQARFSIRNISSIPNDALPAIRKLIERDLKAHGVTIAGEESANAIRVTLSENAHERLWVGEITEGNVTQVAMVEAGAGVEKREASIGGVTLRLQTILVSREPVLSALETANGLVVLEPEQIVLYTRGASGWSVQSRASIGSRRSLTRDPRGILIPDASSAGFDAWLAGTECTGADAVGSSPNDWTVNCRQSDDPWPIVQASWKAFYNSARNYFTGVITPSLGTDIPAFYTAASIPRPGGGVAFVAGNIDGKVAAIENGSIKAIAGTRDWGSDFAAINSGCGAGTQIVASGSGAAVGDSLRAYEIPALEAIPVSNPLELSGTVTALEMAPDEKSAFAVVKTVTNQYEVDRVTALCN